MFFQILNTNIYSTNSVWTSETSPKAAQHLPVNEEAFMKFKSIASLSYWKILAIPEEAVNI